MRTNLSLKFIQKKFEMAAECLLANEMPWFRIILILLTI